MSTQSELAGTFIRALHRGDFVVEVLIPLLFLGVGRATHDKDEMEHRLSLCAINTWIVVS
jgi:hypothetical protein